MPMDKRRLMELGMVPALANEIVAQVGSVTTDNTINAKARGAKGDGVTDDYAALQACLDDATLRNVYLPSGIYYSSQPLKIRRSFSSLFGDSASNTVIVTPPNIGSVITVRNQVPGQLQQVELRNLKLQSVSASTSGYQIDAEAVNGLKITGIYGGNNFSGVRLAGCYGVTANDCYFTWGENAATGKLGLVVEDASPAYGGGICANIHLSNFNINSVWVPGSSGTPGLESAMVVRAVDGIWTYNSYLGSTSGPTVLMDNSTGKFCTGVGFSGGWIDHGTSVLFRTQGTAADNFGQVSLDGTRLFGGIFSENIFDLRGNVKNVVLNGLRVGGTKGSLLRCALQGNGGRVVLNGGSWGAPGYGATTAGAACIRVESGSNISATGAIFDGSDGAGNIVQCAMNIIAGSNVKMDSNIIIAANDALYLGAGTSRSSFLNNDRSQCASTTLTNLGTNNQVAGNY